MAWPERIDVARLSLTQPWVLIERDTTGALTLRSLLTPRRPAGDAKPARGEQADAKPMDARGAADAKAMDARRADEEPADAEPEPTHREPLTVAVQRVDVEGGGMRVVDHRVAPPFALDLASLAVQVNGFSTEAERPARIVMAGRAGPSARWRSGAPCARSGIGRCSWT